MHRVFSIYKIVTTTLGTLVTQKAIAKMKNYVLLQEIMDYSYSSEKLSARSSNETISPQISIRKWLKYSKYTAVYQSVRPGEGLAFGE